MQEKILTIVIPAYNVDNTITKAIHSITSGKYSAKLEVLIINDGSNDSTKEICLKLIKDNKNNNVELILINKKNGGHGSVINTGIKKATGKYFKILDGDDYFDTKNLEQLINILKKHNSDIVITDYIEEYNHKTEVIIWNKEKLNTDKIDHVNLLNTKGIILPCINIKSMLLKNSHKQIDENCFYDDQEYNFFATIFSQTITYAQIPVYIYRLGNQNQSVALSGYKKNIKCHEKVCIRLLQEFNNTKNYLSKNKREYLEKNIIGLCYLQYKIAIYYNASRKDFLSFDNALKIYKDFYNNKGVAGKRILIHRLLRGILIHK